MFDDLKTYGIISVLLILVLGYFVYIIYRDTIVLKNEVKEIKEFFYNEVDEEDGDEVEYEEYEEDQPQMIFTDVDEYFSHVKPTQLPIIEELPQEEVIIEVEEKVKKRKPRKSKKVQEITPIEINPDLEAEPLQE